MEARCPLTGLPGRLLRKKTAAELFGLYESYHRCALPADFKQRYFSAEVSEYYSPESGLRWYSPDLLGDSDYYGTLARIYPWYYNSETWDKKVAFEVFQKIQPKNILEIGCGQGVFLKKLRAAGLDGMGLDINESAVALARSEGLKVYKSADDLPTIEQLDTLCLFQTIEHVSRPGEFLATFSKRFQPKHIVLSAPCFESLLGHTDDPLAWPPHHATSWSAQAFSQLGKQISYEVIAVHHDDLDYGHFESILKLHKRKLARLPYIPAGRMSWWAYRLGKVLNLAWAKHAHSILAVLRKKTSP